LTKVLVIRNGGNLDLGGHAIVNLGSGSAMASGANLDLASNGLLNVGSITSPPSGAVPSLALTGYQYVDQKTSQSGTWRWFGNNAGAQVTVDNAGNLTANGTIQAANLALTNAPASGAVAFYGTLGWITNDGALHWDNSNDRLGILTNTPSAALSVGTGSLFQVNASGAIAAAAGITSSGAITFSGLGTGVVHANVSGVLSSGLVNLATDVLGVLPVANGGTGNSGLGAGIVHTNTSGVFSSNLVSLATDVSGTLPVANGGTNNYLPYTAGSVIFADGTMLNQNNNQLFWDNANRRLGIGVTTPSARLTVAPDGGSELQGSVMSTTLRTNAGVLGTTGAPNSPPSELVLASFGFTTANNVAFGVRAIRTAQGGSIWGTTSIGLGMDVDNTSRAGPSLWLGPNGNVGIGSGNFQPVFIPQASLHLNTGSFQIASTKIADNAGCYYAQ
jgi:hypothetical protein